MADRVAEEEFEQAFKKAQAALIDDWNIAVDSITSISCDIIKTAQDLAFRKGYLAGREAGKKEQQ